MLGEMKYKNSLIERIEIESCSKKPWVVVYFENGTRWVPALIEQGLIAQKVALCEKMKYPDLKWSAEEMPAQFIAKAIKGGDICTLAYEYNLTHTRAYKKFCIRRSK